MPLSRQLLALLLGLLATSRALALDWSRTSAGAQARPFQETLEVVFDFRNSGSRTVRILDLQTSCHCTTATVDKPAYAPGEKGRLTALFTLGDRVGEYERQISVVTDDSAIPQHLSIHIDVPEITTITPRVLEWSIGSDAREQSVDLRVNDAVRINFKEAVPTNGAFAVRLETVQPERIFRLVVRPLSTAAVANAAIRIHGRDRTGHEVLVSAYANVR